MVSSAPIVSSLREAAHTFLIERGWSRLRRDRYLLQLTETAFLTATIDWTSYSSQGWIAVDWIFGLCHEPVEKLRVRLLSVEFKRGDPRYTTRMHGLSLAPQITGKGLTELISDVFRYEIGIDVSAFLIRFFAFFDANLIPAMKQYGDLATYTDALRKRRIDFAGTREQRALVGLYLLGEYRAFDEEYRNGLALLQAKQPQAVEEYEVVAMGLRSMIAEIEDSIPE